MKRKILVTFFSIAILTMATAPAGTAHYTGQETNLSSMKADAQRVEKLRYGYITYERNKMVYYW